MAACRRDTLTRQKPLPLPSRRGPRILEHVARAALLVIRAPECGHAGECEVGRPCINNIPSRVICAAEGLFRHEAVVRCGPEGWVMRGFPGWGPRVSAHGASCP